MQPHGVQPAPPRLQPWVRQVANQRTGSAGGSWRAGHGQTTRCSPLWLVAWRQKGEDDNVYWTRLRYAALSHRFGVAEVSWFRDAGLDRLLVGGLFCLFVCLFSFLFCLFRFFLPFFPSYFYLSLCLCIYFPLISLSICPSILHLSTYSSMYLSV